MVSSWWDRLIACRSRRLSACPTSNNRRRFRDTLVHAFEFPEVAIEPGTQVRGGLIVGVSVLPHTARVEHLGRHVRAGRWNQHMKHGMRRKMGSLQRSG